MTSLRDQCVDAKINFHFKQWGNWRPIAADQAKGRATQELLTASGRPFTVANLGKKAAGRLLQGRTWDEFPTTSSKADVLEFGPDSVPPVPKNTVYNGPGQPKRRGSGIGDAPIAEEPPEDDPWAMC